MQQHGTVSKREKKEFDMQFKHSILMSVCLQPDKDFLTERFSVNRNSAV